MNKRLATWTAGFCIGIRHYQHTHHQQGRHTEDHYLHPVSSGFLIIYAAFRVADDPVYNMLAAGLGYLMGYQGAAIMHRVIGMPEQMPPLFSP